jgi:hypothetical protein
MSRDGRGGGEVRVVLVLVTTYVSRTHLSLHNPCRSGSLGRWFGSSTADAAGMGAHPAWRAGVSGKTGAQQQSVYIYTTHAGMPHTSYIFIVHVTPLDVSFVKLHTSSTMAAAAWSVQEPVNKVLAEPNPSSPSKRRQAGGGPPRKRLRYVAQACDQCKRQKVRCNGRKPCNRCEKLRPQECCYQGRQHMCECPEYAGSTSGGPLNEENGRVANTLDNLSPLDSG